uniref:Phorbol-ester/DAG-type domain-containing protein n=1 Tax=Panstrongylus megistus TaxID=65343 RepID=A0A069DTM8_9HEMI
MDSVEDLWTLTPSPSPEGNSGDDLSDSATNLSSISINAENYITVKEGCQSAFTVEELTLAVSKCEKLVMQSEECSEERKWLVRRLIELRHRLEQAKENETIKPSLDIEESQVILGHHFKIEYQPTSTNTKYCDTCCGTIWNMVQSYYQCIDCQYKCHAKCINALFRVCVHLLLSENPYYESEICPEVGLDEQNYCCYECRTPITFSFSKGYYFGNPFSSGFSKSYYFGSPFVSGSSLVEARRCDYNGRYYCPSCHWNTLSVIPARVIHNWDFEQQPVSQASYQLIRISKSRPMIVLSNHLYAFVEELAAVKKLRQELSHMKQYIATCRYALESGLLMRELEWRRHLVHSTEVFSLNDLIDINNGQLLSKIESVHSVLRDHITKDCTVCRGRGFICEFCEDKEIIFPFDTNIYVCPKCDYVLHKHCWTKQQYCPKCVRKEQKTERI